MKPLNICLVMLGAPFDNVKSRLEGRVKLYGEICEYFYLIIDKAPAISTHKQNVNIIDLNMQMSYKTNVNSTFIGFILKVKNLILILSKMSYMLLKVNKNVDVIIFATGIPFVLPLILQSRVMNKKVVIMAGGTCYRSFKADNQKRLLFYWIIWMLEMMCYYFASNIAAETERTVLALGLERFKSKFSIFGALIHIDVDYFKINNEFNDRPNLVGYISDLTVRKGILNLIEAEELILQKKNDIKFLIGGTGPLYDKIKKKLESKELSDKIMFVGRIPPEEMVDYFNKMKLLVLPSYSEGLPGIILEAMACGTPVLATAVGGVPDIIKDGENGFIMNENSPISISEHIDRALNHHNLNRISENARRSIENEYSFKATAKKYEHILKLIAEENDQN